MRKITIKKWAVAAVLALSTSIVVGQTLDVPTGPQEGVFTVEVDLIPSHSNLNGGVGVAQKDSVAGWGDMSSIIGFTPESQIRARNGGAYQVLNQMTYEKDMSYHLVMTVDVPNMKYSATLNDVVVAYDFAFRAETDSIAHFFTYCDTNTAWGGMHGSSIDTLNFQILDETVEIKYGITEGNFTSIPVASQSGLFIAEFDAVPSADTINGAFAFSNDTAKAWGDLSPIIRFNTYSKIDVRNGSGYEAMVDYKYWGGRSYHFMMELDVFTNTYSVYVTGDDGEKVLLAVGYDFRNLTDELNYRVAAIDTSAAWGRPGTSLDILNFGVKHDPAVTTITLATTNPVIDGDLSDGYWDDIAPNMCETRFGGNNQVSNTTDLSAYWKAVWTSDSLFIMANVTDDSLVQVLDPTWAGFAGDGVHVHWGLANNRNGLGSRATTTDTVYTDSTKLFGQYYYTFDGADASGGEIGHWVAGVTSKVVANDTGYVFEASYSWAAINKYGVDFNAEMGTTILFDVDVVDNDGVAWWSYSESQWSAAQNNWANMDDAGQITLTEIVDYEELISVVDSSDVVVAEKANSIGDKEGQYSQATTDAANAAITEGKVVIEYAEATTQAEVDGSTADLRSAMELFLPNAYDYTELTAVADSSKAAVVAQNDNIGDEAGQYTQEVMTAATAAVTTAEAVIDNAYSQEEVDQATADLRTAMELFIPNPVSVNELLDDTFAMYPNPVKGMLQLDNISNVQNISVYSITGRLIISQTNTDNSLSLNLSELNTGMYIIKFSSENGVSTKRFTKE